MFIKSDTNKIKYINFAYYASSNPDDIRYCVTNSLNDFVRLDNLGKEHFNFQIYANYHYNNADPTTATGIYLGNDKDIRKEINSKLNMVNLDTIKQIYFDSCSKYPRFKLANINIKRCIDYTKADAVVIKPPLFSVYIPYIKTHKCESNVLILYSNKEDCYYLIDYYPLRLSDLKKSGEFSQYFSLPPTKTNKEKLNYWASALINCGTLPIDCKEFYYGEVILTSNKDQAEFLNNLPSYKSCIFEYDLNNFISDNSPKLTKEFLESIDKMLASNDNSSVELALKSLSGYDIRSHICRLSYILFKYRNKIMDTSAYNSKGFQTILEYLNITRSVFNYGSIMQICNSVYILSKDEEDRKFFRDVMIEKIIASVTNYYNSNYHDSLKNLDLKFNVTVE